MHTTNDTDPDGHDTNTAEAEIPDIQGRHRSHAGPHRTHRLTPRFNQDELAEVTRAAASVGMTPTGFCAESAIAAARGTPMALANGQEREAFARLQRQLFAARTAVVRFGTNVNQAVAAFNATGAAPDWLVQAVTLCVRSVRQLDEVVAEVDRRLR
jgi:hypothetical protein